MGCPTDINLEWEKFLSAIYLGVNSGGEECKHKYRRILSREFWTA